MSTSTPGGYRPDTRYEDQSRYADQLPYANQPYAPQPYASPPYANQPYTPEPPRYADDELYLPPSPLPGAPSVRRARVATGKLWGGGVMASLVAALTLVVCMMLVRGVLGIAVFAPERDGTLAILPTSALAAGAAAAALLATALLHLLLLAVPQPEPFFTCIVALATVSMMLMPFTTGADWPAKIATAFVHLVLGLVIGGLLSAVGRGAYARRGGSEWDR